MRNYITNRGVFPVDKEKTKNTTAEEQLCFSFYLEFVRSNLTVTTYYQQNT